MSTEMFAFSQAIGKDWVYHSSSPGSRYAVDYHGHAAMNEYEPLDVFPVRAHAVARLTAGHKIVVPELHAVDMARPCRDGSAEIFRKQHACQRLCDSPSCMAHAAPTHLRCAQAIVCSRWIVS